MATTQSKHGRKFDEEFKREVATLASAPGKTDEAVGRDLGVREVGVQRVFEDFVSGRQFTRVAPSTSGTWRATAPIPGVRNR